MPGDTPVTTPVPDTTVATEGLLLLHVPPLVPSVKVVVAGVQIFEAPLIDAGAAFTVTVAEVVQPEPNE